MGNLNELHVPPDADEATDFAARREFGLRYDSYQQAKLWRVTEPYNLIPPIEGFACVNPEEAWIHSMRVDLTDDQKERWVR